MNGSEEANIVSTECGEGERQRGNGKGAVPDWPKTWIEDQHPKLSLTIEVALGGKVHQLCRYLSGKVTIQ